MNYAEDKIMTEPAARMAQVAPREWQEFREAFRDYAYARRDELVSASQEEILRAQGRAQQCNKLLALFDDAVNAANRVNAPAGKRTS